ncbi:MAG: S8 family serine peptidase [Chloroflexi bacterium]|nr:S8 family serine peptidase [Chloroflexota bacterium]
MPSIGAYRIRHLATTCSSVNPQDAHFPRQSDDLWFHDGDHGQFADALAAIGQPAPGNIVRVAHCDTGYFAEHHALPANLNTALQHNFVDADRPNDARDDSSGPLNNFGHGTGTLGVLAGKALPGATAIGAAPFVEVVPIRVANGVALVYNSAIARAFDYVHGLCADPQTQIHVITMSMGGLASQSWADAVNALYDAGVFIVTAAGNNQANLPTRNIVFPARFNRVVAACGVMADNTAYADLGTARMAGNHGPSSKMRTAMAGWTPNIPWARIGCPDTVDWNGAGTSCATPQVAAAAAIWIQANKAAWDAYAQGWMRVEAVRKALFDSATVLDQARLGRGELRANAARQQAPAQAADLHAEGPDNAAFPFLRVLTGLGVAGPDPHQRMLELEALQLSQSAAIEQLLPDPAVDPASLSPAMVAQIREALASHPRASSALRDAVKAAPRPPIVPVARLPGTPAALEQLQLQRASQPKLPVPTRRRLRVYAYDPSLGTRLETLGINEAVVDVPWEEDLQPGPVGEYLELIDVDPASQCCYAPVALNHPHLLVQDGLAPSETNPQFQQQMAYAIASKTIEHFERALGRVALWAPNSSGKPNVDRGDRYVQRLRIYPHALRAGNAFYSPERRSLLLGYFFASQTTAVDMLPGGVVFTALSSDIVAHETTHALLDGLHRRFREPTNADVLAFHEAFADMVALFQHFSMPESLRQQIASTRGDLGTENLLAELAVQFGNATGQYGGLRNAIGALDSDRKWHPAAPSLTDYQQATEAHARGSVLVAAVFDAFLQIYRSRSADLVRLATGGSGVLPAGAISVDLANRLAQEASKAATHVLGICIRALDYCPPVDITFGEYLRALITADRDLVREDTHSYRVAFVTAFRARGIYPSDVKTLSVESLVWESPPVPLSTIKTVLDRLLLDWDLMADRQTAFEASRSNARKVHQWLMDPVEVSQEDLTILGLFRQPGPMTIGTVTGELQPIEVHSVRPARRIGPDGQLLSDVVVEITQTFRPADPTQTVFRGGCTLLVDLRTKEVRYLVRKRVDHAGRLAKQQAFAAASVDMLRASYFDRPDQWVEPFALLHGVY